MENLSLLNKLQCEGIDGKIKGKRQDKQIHLALGRLFSGVKLLRYDVLVILASILFGCPIIVMRKLLYSFAGVFYKR